jgi:tetratricopeptide (TPR) repeat protein
VYKELLDKYRSDVEPFLYLAKIYTKTNQYQQAVHSCRLATEKQPKNFWLWRSLIGIYVTRHDYAGAIEECIKALQRFPYNISLALVDLYSTRKDYAFEPYMDNIRTCDDLKRNWLSAISQDAPDVYSEELRQVWYHLFKLEDGCSSDWESTA